MLRVNPLMLLMLRLYTFVFSHARVSRVYLPESKQQPHHEISTCKLVTLVIPNSYSVEHVTQPVNS